MMSTPSQTAHHKPRRQALLWVASHAAVATVAFLIGGSARPNDSAASSAVEEEAAVTGVTGIGGVFFTSANPSATLDWYHEHLGVEPTEFGLASFQWTEKGDPAETGYTIWSPFPDTTDYFDPSSHRFMVNFRVGDLTELVASLTQAGVPIVGGIEQHPNGLFAWVVDPEGRKIELWEPVPSREDPYLR